MKRILTINKDCNIDKFIGTSFLRVAYRAIISKDNQVLFIKSSKFGEMKFPGGGKEPKEIAYEVLKREVLEETGYLLKSKIRPFGRTMEYTKDFKKEYDIYIQDSRYYLCQVHDYQQKTNYAGYEIEYGYYPIWATLDEAIANNEGVQSNNQISWLERDTEVMRILLSLRSEK
jgi:8-oxo-dGTP pyrophosphatase MutT (NUDIX family)